MSLNVMNTRVHPLYQGHGSNAPNPLRHESIYNGAGDAVKMKVGVHWKQAMHADAVLGLLAIHAKVSK